MEGVARVVVAVRAPWVTLGPAAEDSPVAVDEVMIWEVGPSVALAHAVQQRAHLLLAALSRVIVDRVVVDDDAADVLLRQGVRWRDGGVPRRARDDHERSTRRATTTHAQPG